MELKNQMNEYIQMVNEELEKYFTLPKDKNEQLIEAMR